MITAILNGDLETAEYTIHDVFKLNMPTNCKNVPSDILNPKNTWKNKNEYDEKANELANAFNENFEQFAEYANDEILNAAPKCTIQI